MSDFNNNVGKGAGIGIGLIIALVAVPLILIVLCCGGCFAFGGLGAIMDGSTSTSSTY